jgi:chromosome segregation ATPase
MDPQFIGDLVKSLKSLQMVMGEFEHHDKRLATTQATIAAISGERDKLKEEIRALRDVRAREHHEHTKVCEGLELRRKNDLREMEDEFTTAKQGLITAQHQIAKGRQEVEDLAGGISSRTAKAWHLAKEKGKWDVLTN